jgi:hypothetical protein
MNCFAFEDLAAEYHEGRLAPEKRAAAEDHLAGCADCRQLLSAASGDAALLSEPEARDLARSILKRTSGLPCARTRRKLKSFIQGTLPYQDARLIERHLDHCPSCRVLAVRKQTPFRFHDFLLRPGLDWALPYAGALVVFALLVGLFAPVGASGLDLWSKWQMNSQGAWSAAVEQARLESHLCVGRLSVIAAHLSPQIISQGRVVWQSVNGAWLLTGRWMTGNMDTVVNSPQKARSAFSGLWQDIVS